MPAIGDIAALTTAFCWTASALAFEAAGRRVGSLPTNLIRMAIAVLLLAACHLVQHGAPLPAQAPGAAWAWLGLSGVVGFFLGDLCLFRAFVLIGSRLALLTMSLAPPLTALLGWAVLGETLRTRDWAGMAVTLAGVAWVVAEGRPAGEGRGRAGRVPPAGVLLALGGALGQAGGLVLAKLGTPHTDGAVAATLIRALAGLAAFALLFLVLRLYPRVAVALRDGRGMALTAAGAAAGPFLGVALLLFAIRSVSVGRAQTFVAITPVLVIPFSMWLHGEKVSLRAWLGALLAFAGIAILLR